MMRNPARARGRQLLSGLIVAAVAAAFVLAELATRPAGAAAGVNILPEVGFPSKDFTVNESDGSGSVEVTISAAPAEGAEVVVSYVTLPGTAISGAAGDYLDTTGVITFTHASPTTQTFQVVINDDTLLNEPDETINLILYLLTPATATITRNVAIMVITDNDVTPPAQTIYAQPVLAPDLATPQLPQRP